MLLDDHKTVWEEVGEGNEYVRLSDESITLRGYLRRFLFTEDRINSKIHLLSGGERSRVLHAKILKRGGNVLMLDEPTNDLDLGTLRLLEEALVAFDGSVVVVSHDRYFLNRVCASILAFEGDGVVRYSIGDYDHYLEKRAERLASSAAPPTTASSARGSERLITAQRPRKLNWSERQELETIEDKILAAEENVVRLEAQFADRISTPSAASIGRCLMRNSELPEKMFLSFTAAGRNWNKSEPNDSALRPMFNGRFAAANGVILRNARHGCATDDW
jgi:ATP-binding cassette subfamily F protein uup